MTHFLQKFLVLIKDRLEASLKGTPNNQKHYFQQEMSGQKAFSKELEDSICHNRLHPRSILNNIIPGISISLKFTMMLQEPYHTTDILSFLKQPKQKTADLASLYEMLEDGTIDLEKYLHDMRPTKKEEITVTNPGAPLSQKEFSPLNPCLLPPKANSGRLTHHLDNEMANVGLHLNREISFSSTTEAKPERHHFQPSLLRTADKTQYFIKQNNDRTPIFPLADILS